MPRPARAFAAVAAYQDAAANATRLFVFGGAGPANTSADAAGVVEKDLVASDELWVFAVHEGRWQRLAAAAPPGLAGAPAGLLPLAWASLQVAAGGSRLYLAGGYRLGGCRPVIAGAGRGEHGG